MNKDGVAYSQRDSSSIFTMYKTERQAKNVARGMNGRYSYKNPEWHPVKVRLNIQEVSED